MSALIKLRQMSVLQKSAWIHLNKVSRCISTSKRNRESVASANACEPNTPTEKKNWVSYGFDYKSQEEDTNVHNASFFFSISLVLVFGGFLWSYGPDVTMRDWAQREAFLELRRREKANQPLIDPNYTNPKSVKLPTEAELCDVEIII